VCEVGKQFVDAVAEWQHQTSDPRKPQDFQGSYQLVDELSRQNLGVDTQKCLRLGNFGIPLGKLIGGEELHDAFACSPADGL